MIAVVVLVNVLAFLIAYLLTRGFKGQNFFRAGFFTPNLIGGIVLGYIWQFVFSRVFVSIGEATDWNLFEISWLSKPNTAFAAMVLVTVWQLSGYMILIYVAGFTGLDTEVMEAASIDGASGWKKMKNIILPLMMPSITICMFLTLTNGFKLFDQNLALTAGRPFIQNAGETVKTTEMLALNIYSSFYASTTNRGVGQAKAVIFFVLVAAISILQLSSSRKKEVQQ